jgi:hypothetical protein
VSARGRYLVFLALVVAAGALGLAWAALGPREPETRGAALVGVGEAFFSGLVALELKRRALARSVNWAVAMVAVMFLVRLLMVSLGLVVVVRVAGWSGMAFAVGFFAEYFVLQFVELTYVLIESKRRGQGGV